jgi:hypothetical protein
MRGFFVHGREQHFRKSPGVLTDFNSIMYFIELEVHLRMRYPGHR